MITCDKLLAFPERIRSDRRPITADLFLTRRCNNACGYCTYTRHMRRSGPEMGPELFDRVLRRLMDLGVRGVILTGGGEPTVAQSFTHATAELERAGMPYGINTNFNRYVECRPAYLKVSLDGWDRESYLRARGVDAYQTVRGNIRRFWEWKSENSKETRLVVQMVATRAEDVARFWDANGDLPFDAMVFRPVESRLGGWYGTSDASDVVAAVDAIGDPRAFANPKFGQLHEGFGSCLGNHLQIAVDESANVVYCCHKPYEVVGSLFDPDILQRKEAFRTDMSACDVPCRLTSGNILVRRSDELLGMVDASFI